MSDKRVLGAYLKDKRNGKTYKISDIKQSTYSVNAYTSDSKETHVSKVYTLKPVDGADNKIVNDAIIDTYFEELTVWEDLERRLDKIDK